MDIILQKRYLYVGAFTIISHMENPELLGKAGKKVVLLGNEAIARGAIEAGLGLAACYPGTPSSEVGLSLADIAKVRKKTGLYFEWSTNEKVAAEVAAAASYCGVKTLTAMKHFGFNVASDSLLPFAYTGVRGGMVVYVADDPQGHSSAQSEQDSRFYAKMGNFPMLEPTNPQECKDFTIKAFEISKRFQIPVIIRTTTMTSHSIGTVRLGTIPQPVTKGRFKKDPDKYFSIRPHLQVLHHRVIKKMADIEKAYSNLNEMEGTGKSGIGIITSGVSYNYVKEVCSGDVRIAKLNLTNPISRKFVARFLKGLKKAIVVEELEPVVEDFVRKVALDVNPKVKIHGKDLFPRVGELLPTIVEKGLVKAGVPGVYVPNFSEHEKSIQIISRCLLPRKPIFCPGCPHAFTYKSVKKVMGKDTVWAGDVGCYTIGLLEPYNMADFVISMGASQGMSHGIRKVSKQKVVAFIGDSTFFHAGMPGIANIVYNESDPLIIVMDNGITAMTGHQPHPGAGFNATWDETQPIDIEAVARGIGIKHVKVVNPMDSKKMEAAVRAYKNMKGPRMIISRCMCALHSKRLARAGLTSPHKRMKK